MERLSRQNLERLPSGVRRPTYDLETVRIGIVHLGVGAFQRAHQAVYTDDVLASGDLRWGICGASLRSAATRDALEPQDCLYTVSTKGDGNELRVVGALREVLTATDGLESLLHRMCDPSVAIVSLTVTEKGYGVRPGTRELDEMDPQLLADLANPSCPTTTLGILTEAIRMRREIGARPFTVLSCDNLSDNGTLLHKNLVQFALQADADLAAFIEDEIVCPSTMVDRIVPATIDDDRVRVSSTLGFDDRWPVNAEPFSDWVIEDCFTSGRPQWELAGARFARNVRPFEAMKLRLLNASHSAMAYLGLPRGHRFVHQAILDPGIRLCVEALMRDAADTLPAEVRSDWHDYARRLLVRFSNEAIEHRLEQIAEDGSLKLVQRLLPVIQERLDRGLPAEVHLHVLAAWVDYATDPDNVTLRDPLSDSLRSIALAGLPWAETVEAVLAASGSAFQALRNRSIAWNVLSCRLQSGTYS